MIYTIQFNLFRIIRKSCHGTSINTYEIIARRAVNVKVYLYTLKHIFDMWKGHNIRSQLHQHSVKNIHQVMK